MLKKLNFFILASFLIILLIAGQVLAESWQDLDLGFYNLNSFEEKTGTEMTDFNESPLLKEKVNEGELPSVEERLPDNPLVYTPWMEIGEYGGTLRWIADDATYDVYLRHINCTPMMTRPSSDTYFWPRHAGPHVGDSGPGVLEKWELSEDMKVITAKIREGLRWSDGEPVTTEDVEYYIRDVLMNKDLTPSPPEWMTVGADDEITLELEIVDEYTFKFKYPVPNPVFRASSGVGGYNFTREYWQLYMKPKHYLKQFHKDYTSWDKLLPLMEKDGYNGKEEWASFYNSISGIDYVGSGGILNRPNHALDFPTLDPFVPVEIHKDGTWIFERNPYYHVVDPEGNQLPYIDKGKRGYVNEREMIPMEIISGKVDIGAYSLNIEDYPMYSKNQEKGNYNVTPVPATQHHYLIFPFNLGTDDEDVRKVLQNLNFRKALSVALDREHMKRALFLDFGHASQYSPPEDWVYYEEGMQEAYASYSPEKAKQLLDEMGMKDVDGDGWRERPDGESFKLNVEHYGVSPVGISGAELAQRYWQDIGIEVELEYMDGSLFWQRQSANEIQVTVWWGHGPNPTDAAWLGFAVSAPQWRQWYNTGGKKGIEPLPWAKKMLELQEEFMTTPTREEEKWQDIGKEIWKLQTENLPVIGTVAQPKSPFIYSKDLGNISVVEEKDYHYPTLLDAGIQWYFKD